MRLLVNIGSIIIIIFFGMVALVAFTDESFAAAIISLVIMIPAIWVLAKNVKKSNKEVSANLTAYKANPSIEIDKLPFRKMSAFQWGKYNKIVAESEIVRKQREDKENEESAMRELYAMLERDELPELPLEKLDFNIILKKDEVCHFFAPVSLLEYKTNTQYVGGSAGVSFRVAKGVTIRTSSFKGNPVKTENLTTVDNGMLVLTNKKISFNGSRKNVTYPLEKIADARQDYSDALTFIKENDSATKLFQFKSQKQIDIFKLLSAHAIRIYGG